MLFEWTPNFIPNRIYIFGCGGTGSRVVPLIAQFVKSCAWVIDPEITLIDFDRVEEKNLTRQNFVAQDVGRHKSAVLATRYSKAFNVNMSAVTCKISKSAKESVELEEYYNISDDIHAGNSRNNLFILCVDSPDARRDIVQTIIFIVGNSQDNIIIDAGNENDFGQVVVSSTATASSNNYTIDQLKRLDMALPIMGKLNFIPIDRAYYKDMATVDTPSCAALDQTMAINSLMAVNIFAIVQNIYYVKPMSFYRVNISLQHGSSLQYIQPNYLISIMAENKKLVGNLTNGLRIDTQIDKVYTQQLEFQEQMATMKRMAELEVEEKKKKLVPMEAAVA